MQAVSTRLWIYLSCPEDEILKEMGLAGGPTDTFSRAWLQAALTCRSMFYSDLFAFIWPLVSLWWLCYTGTANWCLCCQLTVYIDNTSAWTRWCLLLKRILFIAHCRFIMIKHLSLQVKWRAFMTLRRPCVRSVTLCCGQESCRNTWSRKWSV